MDSTRFMASSLSNLVNNFAEEIHKIKCKYEHNDKKCESCRVKHKYRDCFLEYTNFKDDLIEYKCLCCNKNYQQKFAENLKEWFFNTYKFYNSDNNKFILLVWKGVYPYQCIDDWDKFNETSLPEKIYFYSHLNKEDLYVQSNTLLLADAFENFRNMSLEIYEPDPEEFLSAPGLTWQAALKRIKVKLDLLTDINMFWMVEKGIRGALWTVFIDVQKLRINIWKIMITTKNHHIFNIRM